MAGPARTSRRSRSHAPSASKRVWSPSDSSQTTCYLDLRLSGTVLVDGVEVRGASLELSAFDASKLIEQLANGLAHLVEKEE